MIVYLKSNLKTHNDYTPLMNDDEVTEKLAIEGDDELNNSNSVKSLKIKILEYAALISLIAITTCPLPLPVSFVRWAIINVANHHSVLQTIRYSFHGTSYAYFRRRQRFIKPGAYLHWWYFLFLISHPLAHIRILEADSQWESVRLEKKSNLCWNIRSELIVALISSVIMAVITYETFEKWYLRLSSTSVGVMVVILFVLNVVVINKDEIRAYSDHRTGNKSRLDGLTDEMTIGRNGSFQEFCGA